MPFSPQQSQGLTSVDPTDRSIASTTVNRPLLNTHSNGHASASRRAHSAPSARMQKQSAFDCAMDDAPVTSKFRHYIPTSTRLLTPAVATDKPKLYTYYSVMNPPTIKQAADLLDQITWGISSGASLDVLDEKYNALPLLMRTLADETYASLRYKAIIIYRIHLATKEKQPQHDQSAAPEKPAAADEATSTVWSNMTGTLKTHDENTTPAVTDEAPAPWANMADTPYTPSDLENSSTVIQAHTMIPQLQSTVYIMTVPRELAAAEPTSIPAQSAAIVNPGAHSHVHNTGSIPVQVSKDPLAGKAADGGEKHMMGGVFGKMRGLLGGRDVLSPEQTILAFLQGNTPVATDAWGALPMIWRNMPRSGPNSAQIAYGWNHLFKCNRLAFSIIFPNEPWIKYTLTVNHNNPHSPHFFLLAYEKPCGEKAWIQPDNRHYKGICKKAVEAFNIEINLLQPHEVPRYQGFHRK